MCRYLEYIYYILNITSNFAHLTAKSRIIYVLMVPFHIELSTSNGKIFLCRTPNPVLEVAIHRKIWYTYVRYKSRMKKVLNVESAYGLLIFFWYVHNCDDWCFEDQQRCGVLITIFFSGIASDLCYFLMNIWTTQGSKFLL